MNLQMTICDPTCVSVGGKTVGEYSGVRTEIIGSGILSYSSGSDADAMQDIMRHHSGSMSDLSQKKCHYDTEVLTRRRA